MAGHVEKSGSTWKVIIELGRDEEGKRIRRAFRGFKTKKEAQGFLNDKEHELKTGTFIDRNSGTVAELLKQWMEDKRAQVRVTTYRGYEWLVERHLIPHLGHIRLDELKPIHLQTAYRKMMDGEKPLSNRSVKHAHQILSQTLDRAVKWGMLPRNIADAVDSPRAKKTNMAVWDEISTRTFLEAAQGDDYYILFLLAVYTGMRKSEIMGLRWADVDLQTAQLSIRQTLVYNGHGGEFGLPKTNRGQRPIAIPTFVVDTLITHKRQQNAIRLRCGSSWEDHDLVMCLQNGKPLVHRTVDNHWYALLEKAALPKIRFHDIRHTHATLLLKQGVHPKIVSERLGHSAIGITLDTYSHVLPGLQEQAATMFQDMLHSEDKKAKKNSLGTI